MDFARYSAYKLGIPFIAVPTIVSSDASRRTSAPSSSTGRRSPFPCRRQTQ
ncbi:hypothetical protein [Leyella stercorea]|uniref:hypothetical protein n=1 Tax=Leyella stercorea TaxID=363265 RepID=UPI00242D1C4C|nr:hypothetical protein [Leyella stercorea]